MVGLLATGGMAEIYLALSGELSGFRTLVVVKRILPHLASNEDFIRMFFDEARIVAMLDHPNIVRIIEIGQEGDEYFLAMEVIQGKPLSALIRAGVKKGTPLSQPQAAFLVAQAAKGLGHAHQLSDATGAPLNIVHRDVSPQNLLISFDGGVKVIDFGVARAMGRISQTRPGGLKGKLQYMAPEQASGGRVDHRADVFALGVVLWEAICGRRPFKRRSDVEMLRALVHEPIPPPSRYVKISSRLESIVMRALQKHPSDRFDTAQEMALALERFAFASAGFNPAQISTTMKALFPADGARWKKTLAAVRELEGEPEEWINTSGTYLTPGSIDLKTRGATLALHPLPRPELAGDEFEEPAPDSRNGDSRSASSAEVNVVTRSRVRRRRWLMGTLATAGVVLGALSVVELLPPRMLPPLISRVFGDEASRRSPSAPARDRSALETAASTARVELLPVHPTTGSVAGGLAVATGAPEAPADPARPRGNGAGRPESEVQAAPELAPAAAAPDGASPAAATPTGRDAFAAWAEERDHHPVSRPTTKRPPAHTRSRKRPGVSLAGATAKTASAPPSKTMATADSAALSVSPRVEIVDQRSSRGDTADTSCSVRIGSTPWAEVWIDGTNTGKHTPFLEMIPCGKRRLTLKRSDLALEKTVIVDARAGETFKRSYALDGE